MSNAQQVPGAPSSIDLRPGKRPRVTVMSYGPYRSGKTQFMATFPRPLFLSDQSESGWETIREMDRALFYEPDFEFEDSGMPVDVWPIKQAKEMLAGIQKVRTILAREPNYYKSVIVDSLTFYSDAYYSALEMNAYEKSGGKAIDRRHIYQDLGSHLRYLMLMLHEMPGVNVGWISLEKQGEEGKKGGLLLSGQTAEKAPARCDLVLYHRAYNSGAGMTYECHKTPFGEFMAGVRGGKSLPDVMENPSYRTIEAGMGIVPWVPAQNGKTKK